MVARNNRLTKAKKKKKYFVSFNKEWATKGERFAFCTMFGKDFGIEYGGENANERH